MFHLLRHLSYVFIENNSKGAVVVEYRKIISWLTVMTIFISVFGIFRGYAEEERDEVTLIVEVEGEAALETPEAVSMGASDYNETDESKRHTERILSVQERVKSDIKNKVDRKAEFGFSYTNVMNGFSVTADKSDIEKIKALPNVENVYISQSCEYIEPIEQENNAEIGLFSCEYSTKDIESQTLENCCEMINVQCMHENGYMGQGQAVVIIDSELNVNHEMFTSSIENPKYSKSDIEQMLEEKKLNVNIDANQLYQSDKVPFAYNYSDNNSDVTHDFWNIHGTLVSGVAAGKNGTLPNGNKYSGVAPESQIIFMGITDKENRNISEDVILVAIDDASKIDVAAINMSLGKDYVFYHGNWGTMIEKSINTAVNAGIMVSAAAGNAGRVPSVDTEMPDRSEIGKPAGVSAATTVASSKSDMFWKRIFDGGSWEWIYNSAAEKGMYSNSSYGADVTLELKPEITAPGCDIYAPYPGSFNEYAVLSGTSLSAPHIAGAAALMRQYIEEKYTGKYDNPAKFIENLIMTSAKIIRKNETDTPYSPRQQGAGLLDLKAAVTTPVILTGNDGKSKISLKDKLSDTFQIEFTAKNFTDNDIIYDTITPLVFTDDYIGSPDKNVLNGSRDLKFTALNKPENVIVPANGEAIIRFTVKLDSEETAENLNVFTNGFFIDGFVELSDSNGELPTISIPYTGFYGDWTEVSAFNKPYYQNGSANTFLGSNIAEDSTGRLYLGQNQILSRDFTNAEYHAEEYAGISPNGDGNFDLLRVSIEPQRTMSDCNIWIENTSNEVVKTTKKPNAKFDKLTRNCEEFDMLGLPDGDYTVYVSGQLAYEGAKTEEISMKFYVDTEAPKVIKKEVRYEDDVTRLNLSISDNRYVMGVKIEGKNTDNTDFKQLIYTKAGKTSDMSIDITDANISTLKITVLDYAYNKYECNPIDAPTPSPSITPSSSPEPTSTVRPVNTETPENEIVVTMPYEPLIGTSSAAVMFDIENNTENEVSADIVAAVYDADGILKAVSVNRNETFPKGKSSEVFNFDGKFSGKTIKVIIFDGLESMKPLGYGECFDIEMAR